MSGDARPTDGAGANDATGPAPGRGAWAALAKPLAAAALAVGALAIGAAVERAVVRRARSVPDPSAGDPLAERPGANRMVASFDGTRLAVAQIGPGATETAGRRGGSRTSEPTLVFLHGFSLDVAAWHYQWTHFSERYRCVLYDARGHGDSERAASGDYSVEALGRDLLAVMDAACGDAPAVLIGHSMGGMTILSLAAVRPEAFGDRIAGVVLADTAASDVVQEGAGGMLARLEAALRPSVRALAGDRARAERVRTLAAARRADLAFLVARATNFAPGAPPSLVDHVVRAALAADVEIWPKLLPGLVAVDLRPALRDVRVPALVVAGARDRMTSSRSAVALAGGLPDARAVILDGAGHAAPLEQPAAFNDEVGRFLDGLAQRRGARRRAG